MTHVLGTARGTARATDENPGAAVAANGLPSNNLESSWGETRTPDPGIMSAVL